MGQQILLIRQSCSSKWWSLGCCENRTASRPVVMDFYVTWLGHVREPHSEAKGRGNTRAAVFTGSEARAGSDSRFISRSSSPCTLLPANEVSIQGVIEMNTMKRVAAVFVLVAGGLLFLIPGVLQLPGASADTMQVVGDSDFEGLLSSLVDPSTTEDAPSGADETTSPLAADAANSASVNTWDINYATVFPELAVQRLDISMEESDWENLLAQVTSSSIGMAGLRPGVEFGEGMNPPGRMNPPEGMELPPIDGAQGIPAEMMERMTEMFTGACADCEEGEEILFSLNGRQMPGTCVEMDGALVFQPSDAPLPGMESPDGQVPPDGLPAKPDIAPNVAGREVLPPEGRVFQAQQGGRGIESTADADLTYVPCTVTFGENSWEHVGIRFKGNSTLSGTASTDSWKYPLHLDFDEFEDVYPETTNQRFFGFDDLSFSNGVKDASFLRDYISIYLYQAFAVPTPEAAYYQVFLDLGEEPELLGLYTVIEMPDEPMLEAAFGDADGNLYKPQGSGATWSTFDAGSFDKKSNESDEDWSDIEAAIDALHASRNEADVWRSELEDLFDVDGFLRWLAINNLQGNWDSYGQMAQNYYLYHSSSDDLIHWIPWDNNESFSASRQRDCCSIDPRDTGDEWPLISFLLDDPVYFQVYVTYVAEALDTVFEAGTLEALVQETQNLIAPYIADEDGSLSPHSFVDSAQDVARAVDQVLSTAYAKIAEGEAFLESEAYEPSSIVISEIYYNAAASQGRDKEYEFIELYNRGSASVDLSSYRFDDGIEMTLPEGTWLEPDQCLLLAKDASSYGDLATTVYQWDSGSLSNGGETIRLVDADGYWVDYVTYSDQQPWPTSADGDGASLELIDSELPNHIPANWAASSSVGGTPGQVAR